LILATSLAASFIYGVFSKKQGVSDFSFESEPAGRGAEVAFVCSVTNDRFGSDSDQSLLGQQRTLLSL